MGITMKPFDLEAAKAGAPVCTAQGNNVRILAYDRKDGAFTIAALVEDATGDYENYEVYTNAGYYHREAGCEADLRMKPIQMEGWINVYSAGTHVVPKGNVAKTGGLVYESEQIAESAGGNNSIQVFIKWEEK